MAVISDVFSWVLSTSLMASILAGMIFIAKRIFREHLTPRWHYFLWFILLLRLVLPWSPHSWFSVYNLTQAGEKSIVTAFRHFAVHPANAADSALFVPQLYVGAIRQQSGEAGGMPVDGNHTAGLQSSIMAAWDHLNAWLSVLSVLWFAGVFLLGFLFLFNHFKMRCILQQGREIRDPRLQALLSQCKEQLSIHTDIPVIVRQAPGTPTLFGWMRPRVVLSESTLDLLNDDELRYVLLHELSHYKRRDIAVNSLMAAMLALHWFNPLLWRAYARMRRDQEMACDANVLHQLQEHELEQYGCTMIKLLEDFSRHPTLAGSAYFVDRKQYIKSRIKQISVFQKEKKRRSVLGVSLLLLFVCTGLTDPMAIASRIPHEKTGRAHSITAKIASVDKTLTAGQHHANSETGQTSNLVSPQSQPSSKHTVERQIAAIMQYAKQGRLKEYPFIVSGRSTLADLTRVWGEPTSTIQAGEGYYASYKEQRAVFGYNRNLQIFDVRAYMPSYQKLTMSDLENTLGLPDTVHTYQDPSHSQYIWIYKLENTYELQFVFTEPNAQNPDPHINHMNIFDAKAVRSTGS